MVDKYNTLIFVLNNGRDMDRKKFLKNSVLGVGAAVAGTGFIKAASDRKSDAATNMKEQVGFNHLPNKEQKNMQSVFHQAASRGYADHGWLKSFHTFSFANYYNPERVHFGALRVLNDDFITGGTGFGRHPHDNMEIISIPLEGDLKHQDSMGNTAVIRHGDIQVMSAGTGVQHSEMNASETDPSKFLQIWVFPDKRNVTPRYDQITLETDKMNNKLFQIVSPSPEDEGVWMHQKAWFNMGNFEAGKKFEYHLHDTNSGVYVFLLEGSLNVNDQLMERRDGYGIWDIQQLDVEVLEQSRVLLMEVPMNI